MGRKWNKQPLAVILMVCVAAVAVVLTGCSKTADASSTPSNRFVIGGNGEPYDCLPTLQAITFAKNSVQSARWGKGKLKAQFVGKTVTFTNASPDTVVLRGLIIGDDADSYIGMDIGRDGQYLRQRDKVSYDNSTLFASSEGVTADNLDALTGTEVVSATVCAS